MYFSTRKACIEYLRGSVYQFAEKLAQVLPDEIDERSEGTLLSAMEELLENIKGNNEDEYAYSGGIRIGYEPSGHGDGMYEPILRYEIEL